MKEDKSSEYYEKKLKRIKESNYDRTYDDARESWLEDKIWLLKNKVNHSDGPDDLGYCFTIQNKIFFSRNSNWRATGKYKWYKSRGIQDFIKRFCT